MNNIPVTIGIPTRDRYESLALCLLSIAFQTEKPSEIIIVDDSDNRLDIREIPNFQYIIHLLYSFGINYKVIFGQKKGQHFSHSTIQKEAANDWIFRVDDDCISSPDTLRYLYRHTQEEEKLGAVGPLILMPNPEPLPKNITPNRISDIYSVPNVQWFEFDTVLEVGHLNSSFLYRRGIAEFNLSLSKVAHREETIFTHEIQRAGYKLLVDGMAKVYHFRQPSGGIRSYPDKSLYDHDEEIFKGIVKDWNYSAKSKMTVVLDNGLGDHYAFMHILPEVLSKYEDVTIAACYPDIFFEFPTVKLISIAEAQVMYGNLDNYDIYRFMDRVRHKGNLVSAFKQLYAV